MIRNFHQLSSRTSSSGTSVWRERTGDLLIAPLAIMAVLGLVLFSSWLDEEGID